MNESVFKFLRTEIEGARLERDFWRLKQLLAIEGYLKAAKTLRESYAQKRGREYAEVPPEVDQFDVDCARVSP